MLKDKEITIIEKEYFKDLQEIKEIIKRNQNKAMVVVNCAMIIAYYETGVVINKRNMRMLRFNSNKIYV